MNLISVWYFVSCIFVVSQPAVNGNTLFIEDPDTHKNVTELISSKGYPVENHVVQTKDGYILQIQRIPYGRDGAKMENKPVVFLKHGLLAASDSWFLNFPEQSLGFILADAGYDVWLGNTRGNVYCRQHVKYSTSDAEFWDFSFQDIAEYDLPAMIDFILEKTGKQQLFYVGHSQGTGEAFTLLSKSKVYNQKIKLVIALSPVGFVGNVRGILRYSAPFFVSSQTVTGLVGNSEFLGSDSIPSKLIEEFCDVKVNALCANTYFLLTGADLQKVNETRLGVYTGHFPAGTSTKNMQHIGQLILSKKFKKYDYGLIGNYIHYKQFTPPEYDLSKITCDVALFSSDNDDIANPEDVSIIRRHLNTVVYNYKVPRASFNHIDFVIGLDANVLVYSKVVQLLQGYKMK